MVLTERDKRLTSALQSYAILTTRQLATLIFPGIAITTVLRRLRALEEGGYIQRIMGVASTERAWVMTEKSASRDPEIAAKVNFPRHATIAMTERYAHLSPSHLENAIQIVSFGNGISEALEPNTTNSRHPDRGSVNLSLIGTS